MADTVVIELSPPPEIVVELVPGYGVPNGGGGGGTANALSYGESQQLTLAQLRTVRRNIIIGSAPSISYDVNGRVDSITYSDGSIKTFSYAAGLLTRIDHVYASPARTYRKDFTYAAGKLASISESIF